METGCVTLALQRVGRGTERIIQIRLRDFEIPMSGAFWIGAHIFPGQSVADPLPGAPLGKLDETDELV
jgi:hypothetical protein